MNDVIMISLWITICDVSMNFYKTQACHSCSGYLKNSDGTIAAFKSTSRYKSRSGLLCSCPTPKACKTSWWIVPSEHNGAHELYFLNWSEHKTLLKKSRLIHINLDPFWFLNHRVDRQISWYKLDCLLGQNWTVVSDKSKRSFTRRLSSYLKIKQFDWARKTKRVAGDVN